MDRDNTSESAGFEPMDPDSSVFGRASPDLIMRRGRMGEAYIRAGRLSEHQVEQIVAKQKRHGIRFGEAAVSLGLLTEREVNEALSRQFNNAAFLGSEAARNIHRSLAIVHAPGSQDAEAIRRLRAEIQVHLEHAAHFALAVVSPGEGEGKSHVAASLAIAFAQTGVKTMLLDANLRDPVLHKWFNAPNQVGLSTMLAGRSEVALSAAHPVIPDLWLLNSGPLPPNPSEILSPPKLTALLDHFSADIDLFILDTPAVLHAVDAQTIARQSGHALLVARRHVSYLSELRETQADLQNLGVQVVGSVYNEPPQGTEVPRSNDRLARAWRAPGTWLDRLLRGRARKVF